MSARSVRQSLLVFFPGAVALLLFGLYFLGERFTLGELGYPLDDSYIHLQFARQLAAGDGLSFNPGELSTGSTSPLWTALLALGFLIPGLALLWPKLLGACGLLACVFGARRLLAQLGAEPFYQEAGALLVATTPWLLWSALSGMEVLLFAGLVLWTLVAAAADDEPAAEKAGLAAPFLAALAALARPEGLFLVLMLLLCRLFRCQLTETGATRLVLLPLGNALRALIPVTLLVAPLLLFNYWVGGSPWPATLAAKTVPDDSLLPNARYLTAALSVLWDGGGPLLLFAGASTLVLLLRAAKGRTHSLLPLLFFFGLPVAYSLITSASAPPPVGNFGRYLFPMLPLLVVLALLGIEQALLPYRGGLFLGRLELRLAVLLLGGLILVQAFLAVRDIRRYSQNLKDVADSDVAAARYLASRLPAEAVIATQDIGAIKLILPNRIIDLGGIVTPQILPAIRGESPIYWEQRLYDYLANEKPDLVVLFAESYPGLARGRIGNLTQVATFTLERNITMAGDELVILRTPWSRFPAVPAP